MGYAKLLSPGKEADTMSDDIPKAALSRGAGKPRPSRWNRRQPRRRIDHVVKRGDSVWFGEDARREIDAVSKAYGVTLGEIVRTFVLAHAGRMDVEFEIHKEVVDEA